MQDHVHLMQVSQVLCCCFIKMTVVCARTSLAGRLTVPHLFSKSRVLPFALHAIGNCLAVCFTVPSRLHTSLAWDYAAARLSCTYVHQTEHSYKIARNLRSAQTLKNASTSAIVRKIGTRVHHLRANGHDRTVTVSGSRRCALGAAAAPFA